jgi:hypothetical protein
MSWIYILIPLEFFQVFLIGFKTILTSLFQE